MNKIEKAKEKLFKEGIFHSLINYEGFLGNYKDLKFHKGDNPIYFTQSKGLKDNLYLDMANENHELPDRAEDYFKKDYDRGEVLFNADIAIFHNDYVKYIIEVVEDFCVNHKKTKLIDDFFYGHGVHYYQIRADDILKPKNNMKNEVELFIILNGADAMTRYIYELNFGIKASD